jgi:DNA polymerase III delta subunit
MIFVLHGENPLEEQEKLDQIVKKGSYGQRIQLKDESVTLNQFQQNITTPDLFGNKTLVTLEATDSSTEELLEYIQACKNTAENTDVVLVIEKALRSNSKILKEAKKIPELKVISLKKSKDNTIFNFIDAVFEGDRSQAYNLLNKLAQAEEPEFKIFSTLTYQLRNLVRVKHGSKVSAPPFVKTKLSRQAGKYSKKRMLYLCREFYNLDKALKTGKIPENLVNTMVLEKVLQEES